MAEQALQLALTTDDAVIAEGYARALANEVRVAARECGITEITLHDRGFQCPRWPEGVPVWTSYIAAKQGGVSGPWLDDFEAAVLVAEGRVRWSVYETPAWLAEAMRPTGGAA